MLVRHPVQYDHIPQRERRARYYPTLKGVLLGLLGGLGGILVLVGFIAAYVAVAGAF